MTIIWIDDDTEIIDPVVRPIEEAGYEVIRYRTVQDALEAIDIIRASDLILLDMIIPPGEVDEEYGYYSGVDLLCKLREEGIDVPVIVFSVVRKEKLIKQLEGCNVAKYIRKPALPSELKDVVYTILTKKE